MINFSFHFASVHDDILISLGLGSPAAILWGSGVLRIQRVMSETEGNLQWKEESRSLRR